MLPGPKSNPGHLEPAQQASKFEMAVAALPPQTHSRYNLRARKRPIRRINIKMQDKQNPLSYRMVVLEDPRHPPPPAGPIKLPPVPPLHRHNLRPRKRPVRVIRIVVPDKWVDPNTQSKGYRVISLDGRRNPYKKNRRAAAAN